MPHRPPPQNPCHSKPCSPAKPRGHALGVAWGVSLALYSQFGLLGCDKPSAEPSLTTHPIASASAAPPPVDRLAIGELAEGSEKLFGLSVPRKMRVQQRFVTSAAASGPVTPEELANYVRQRVSTPHIEIGVARTIFPKVYIHGGDPGKVYRIEVHTRPSGISDLEVFDITPPPVPEGLTDAERWERAGMKPDGTPLNPKQLQ